MKTVHLARLLGIVLFDAHFTLVGAYWLAAAEARPEVTLDLLSPEVFVGETPIVRITVSAPKDQAVLVLRPDLARVRPDVHFDLLAHGAKAIPAETVLIEYADEQALLAGRFRRLDAGASTVLLFSVLNRAQEPGDDYVVRAEVTMTPDEKWVVKKDLPLRVLEIAAQSIKDRLSFLVRAAVDHKDKVEVMNVVTQLGNQLVFRRSELDGSEVRLYRWCPLDDGSKLVGVLKRFEGELWQGREEILLTFNRAGKLHFVTMDTSVGNFLEERVLGEPEPEEQDQKLPKKRVEVW